MTTTGQQQQQQQQQQLRNSPRATPTTGLQLQQLPNSSRVTPTIGHQQQQLQTTTGLQTSTNGLQEQQQQPATDLHASPYGQQQQQQTATDLHASPYGQQQQQLPADVPSSPHVQQQQQQQAPMQPEGLHIPSTGHGDDGAPTDYMQPLDPEAFPEMEPQVPEPGYEGLDEYSDADEEAGQGVDLISREEFDAAQAEAHAPDEASNPGNSLGDADAHGMGAAGPGATAAGSGAAAAGSGAAAAGPSAPTPNGVAGNTLQASFPTTLLVEPNRVAIINAGAATRAVEILYFETSDVDLEYWTPRDTNITALCTALNITDPEGVANLRLVMENETARPRHLRKKLQDARNKTLTTGRVLLYERFDIRIKRPDHNRAESGTLSPAVFCASYPASKMMATPFPNRPLKPWRADGS
ncbi:unnamed protein product [Closterium sp. NIES-64]|nr:unnamed protein product [Closterium sp. NIES-64]